MELKTKVKDYFPTGSRYICNPPVLDTDEDWVVLVDELSIAIMDLVADGWRRPENNNEYDGGYSYFTTFRKDYFNLIVMENSGRFELWRKATEEAKKQNLLNKEDRVALFESIVNPKPKYNSFSKWYVNANPATGIVHIIGDTVNTITYDGLFQNP